MRAFDSIGVTVEVPRSGTLTSIQLNHDSLRGARFGRRGIALLRLLEPAFRVGIASALEHFFPVVAADVEEHPGPRHRAATIVSGNARLTVREREVVHLLGRRRSNREIAELIGVSPSTAKRHTENILQKLGLTSRQDVERLIIE